MGQTFFNSFFQPSGQFFNPSNVVLKKCKSCPTSNVSVERLIGQLDKKITDVFLTYKVHVLYNDNKTGNQWRRRKHWVEWSNNWVQEYIFNLLLFNFKIKMNTYFTKTNTSLKKGVWYKVAEYITKITCLLTTYKLVSIINENHI